MFESLGRQRAGLPASRDAHLPQEAKELEAVGVAGVDASSGLVVELDVQTAPHAATGTVVQRTDLLGNVGSGRAHAPILKGSS